MCEVSLSNDLRFVVELAGLSEFLSVERQALRHSEAPLVFDLSAKIQVELSDQEAIVFA
jgi:hypothetical protein